MRINLLDSILEEIRSWFLDTTKTTNYESKYSDYEVFDVDTDDIGRDENEWTQDDFDDIANYDS